MLSSKHTYFADIILQRCVQRRYSELWWQVHPFLPPFWHLLQHSSNKQWHCFCSISTKSKCFQDRHHSPITYGTIVPYNLWLGYISVPHVTGFHGHPLLLRPRIFIYWNTLQNSDYYCLSRLPLIIPLQSIPNHVRKWPSIKMQATLILIITQGRYQPPSPSLCNINKINISKRFTILPFILIAVTSSSSGTKMDRLDITC